MSRVGLTEREGILLWDTGVQCKVLDVEKPQMGFLTHTQINS